MHCSRRLAVILLQCEKQILKEDLICATSQNMHSLERCKNDITFYKPSSPQYFCILMRPVHALQNE